MCRTKMAVDAAEPTIARMNPPTPRTQSMPTTSRRTNTSRNPRSPMNPSTSNVSSSTNYNSSSSSNYRLDTSALTANASFSSRTSLSSLRGSLPENAQIYDFSEIRSATNNFLAKRHSTSSSPSWRCSLRGKEVILFQRKIRRPIQTSELKEKLGVIGRSHHLSIVKLLGATISGDFIYLVYEFIQGANLPDCLRNPRNPDFTVLSTWMSRIQIATDLASGLDYIHNNSSLNSNPVHKYVKASSVIVTEPSFNARICHFGTAELCGETAAETKSVIVGNGDNSSENPDDLPESRPELRRSNSRSVQFEGVIGYMSPEFQLTGVATQKSDVYAFGILILELISGEKPVKHTFDKVTREYRRISIVDAARDATDVGSGGGEVDGKLRRWVDRRLKDSFPVEVVERLTRVALQCVDVDPDKRPNMGRVAGKISKMYLVSRKWSDQVRVPMDFSVSLAPR